MGEPGAELRALQEKVAALEAELGACHRRLEQVQRLLCQTERLHREEQDSNAALRAQVPPGPCGGLLPGLWGPTPVAAPGATAAFAGASQGRGTTGPCRCWGRGR